MDLFIHVLSAAEPVNPAEWTEYGSILECKMKIAKTSNMLSVIPMKCVKRIHFISQTPKKQWMDVC